MLKYWLGIVGLFVWVGCSTSFTPQEVKVIKEGGGIMRVWKTDNREDSLFLRQQAIELTPGEIQDGAFSGIEATDAGDSKRFGGPGCRYCCSPGGNKPAIDRCTAV